MASIRGLDDRHEAFHAATGCRGRRTCADGCVNPADIELGSLVIGGRLVTIGLHRPDLVDDGEPAEPSAPLVVVSGIGVDPLRWTP